jgi:hypothetical protein
MGHQPIMRLDTKQETENNAEKNSTAQAIFELQDTVHSHHSALVWVVVSNDSSV